MKKSLVTFASALVLASAFVSNASARDGFYFGLRGGATNYNFNNKESNEEIMENQPKDVIKEKFNNELKLRFRMMQTILKSEVNISPFIDQQRLNTLNPPENLRIAIEKFGWKKKTITA